MSDCSYALIQKMLCLLQGIGSFCFPFLFSEIISTVSLHTSWPVIMSIHVTTNEPSNLISTVLLKILLPVAVNQSLISRDLTASTGPF